MVLYFVLSLFSSRTEGKLAMNLPLLVHLVFLLSVGYDAAISSTQSIQKKYLLSNTGQEVTTYQAYVHARSKVDCIRKCRHFSHCISFVFDKPSGDCYLNPNITSGGGRLVHLYEDAVPTCDVHTMLPVNNGAVQVWRRTLIMLEGDVTCSGDFMESTVSGKVKVYCRANGTWEREGECLQYTFRNWIPRPVREGWSVCLEGTPTANTRFTVYLATAHGDLPLNSDYRFSYGKSTRVTTLNKYQGGAWGTEVSITYFPFVVNQSFKLQITLKTNTSFEIKVNGQVYASFKNTTPSPPQTAFVVISYDITMQLLNLWCTP